MSIKRKIYTTKESEKIRELATAGVPYTDIAKVIGRSPSSVRNLFWRKYPGAVVPNAKIRLIEPEQPPELPDNLSKCYDQQEAMRIGYQMAGIQHNEYNPRGVKIALPVSGTR